MLGQVLAQQFAHRFLCRLPVASNMSTHGAHAVGPVERSIRDKLTTLLKPTSLSISNDSWQHRHHAAMRDSKSTTESHFTIHIVSDAFIGQTTMQRHRTVFSLLKEELEGPDGVHSLSLKTKTPSEIEQNPQ